MNSQKNKIMLTTVVLGAILLSGCASQSQLNSLQSDVNALRELTEQAKSDATKAMEDTTLLKNDLASVRRFSELASTDAAATRKLLEQMNARLEGASGSIDLK